MPDPADQSSAHVPHRRDRRLRGLGVHRSPSVIRAFVDETGMEDRDKLVVKVLHRLKEVERYWHKPTSLCIGQLGRVFETLREKLAYDWIVDETTVPLANRTYTCEPPRYATRTSGFFPERTDAQAAQEVRANRQVLLRHAASYDWIFDSVLGAYDDAPGRSRSVVDAIEAELSDR